MHGIQPEQGPRIIAREDEDVSGTRHMWVLRTSGLAEARAAENTHKSSGKLSVVLGEKGLADRVMNLL